jgi:predicted O-methyltransferase YrrM
MGMKLATKPDRAQAVLEELDASARKNFVPSIGPEKGRILENVIKDHGVNRILEIGSLYGYSAILMARALPKGGKVLTIEVNEGNAEMTRANVKRAGLEDVVEVIEADAIKFLPKLTAEFDMIFIDGVKLEYLHYLKLAEKNLRSGSVVVADNVGVFEKAMADFLDYVRNSGRYRSKTVKVALEYHPEVEDAMEVSIKQF